MGKIILKTFLIILLIPLIGSAQDCSDIRSMKTKARSTLFMAQKKIDAGKKDEALKVLLDFIRESPEDNHAFVPYTAAGIYLERKDIDKAVKMYGMSVSICPSYIPSLQNLGSLLFELKEYKKAAEALESAWEYSDWKKPEILFGAAIARLNSKESSKALTHLFTLSKRDDPHEKWVKLMVNTAIELKKQKIALSITEKLIEKKKRESYLFRTTTSLYLSLENYRKAAENLSSYSKLENLSIADKKLLADLYNAIGIPSKAATLYESLLKSETDEKIHVKEVRSLIEACYFDRAVKSAQSGIKNYPESYELWKFLAWAQFEKKNYLKAAKAFSKASTLNKEDMRSLFMLGLSASKAGLKNTAINALKKVSLKGEYKKKAEKLMKSINSKAG